MNKKDEDKILKAEQEMIKNLRKIIYGENDAGPKYPYSERHCIFCGAKSDLQSYKNFYICQKCLSDISN